MSSFYEDASLVMIPSGYKTSKVYSAKPTDGAGDLSFTRSNDTATRVGPDGLIEKVRTNLALYSEQFDNAAWSKQNTSVTANTMANPLNGALTADTITMSAVTGTNYVSLAHTFVASDTTISFFVKNNGADRVQLLFGSGASLQFANFNLVTGTITHGTYSAASITPLTNGFFRISLTAPAAASGFVSEAYLWFIDTDAAARASASTGDGVKGVFAFGAQLEADVLTDYIATTTAAVSVGPVANVPRLDYLGSSCPRLLLEPQRSNVNLFSEQLSATAYTAVNVSVAANTSVSPDGYTNADTILSTAASPQLLTDVVTFGATTSVSIFVKYVSQEWVQLATGGAVNDYINFNVQTGAVGTIGSTASNAKVENYGNGWSRISATFSGFAGSTTGRLGFVSSGTAGWLSLDTAFNKSVLAYGWQIETGAYATSYIPTLGAAVTRGADVASKTGISSLIGQTEGTLFVEFEYQPTSVSQSIAISDGTSTNRIDIRLSTSNQLAAVVVIGGVIQVSTSAAVTMTQGQRVKAALAYKNNDFALYQNGALVASAAAGTVGGTTFTLCV
jgi:hypothetical protein